MRANAFGTLLLLVCLSSGMTLSSLAQWEPLKGKWTNGSDEILLDSVGNHIVLFSGGSVHEGGSYVAVRVDPNGSFMIASPKDVVADLSVEPSFGHIGDRLLPKTIDGTRVLIIQTAGGGIAEVFVNMGEDSLSAIVDRIKADYQLSGKYLNPGTNKEAVFFPGRLAAEGLTNASRYRFAKAYDYPDDVLIFSDKTTYCYKRLDSALVLYKAIDHDDEEYEKGARVLTLERIGPVDSAGKLLTDRDFPFASRQILTTGILSYFNARQLRLMRNEIFAAHGYIFKSADLQALYSSKTWYKGEYVSVDDQLTDLERLNIRTIQDYKPGKDR